MTDFGTTEGAGRVLVVGLGVTGDAVVRALGRDNVLVVDDGATPALAERAKQRAAELGVELLLGGGPALAAAVAVASLVVISPGVAPDHAVHDLAAGAGVAVVSEVELAWRRATKQGIPVVAITGTNGKTTVTTLVAAMLNESGYRSVAAGNIGLPLISAAAGHHEVLVAEVSSFQLEHTDRFRPTVSLWLNLAEDHLDWHPSTAEYARAKARIWANQSAEEGDVAIANADDPVVWRLAPPWATAFTLRGTTVGQVAAYGIEDGLLRTPRGELILAVTDLPRALPHDLANSLAATAAAIAAGASLEACRTVLAGFPGLPHRIEHIGDAGGVSWYDDSKATTPASVLAALAGFDSVVLIAGGRNKGLDLGVLASAAARLRSVIAIGDAAPEVVRAFRDVRPVTTAYSMTDAVAQAEAAACAGDAVILSPGCASFDWYGSYGERGDDFVRCARARGVTYDDPNHRPSTAPSGSVHAGGQGPGERAGHAHPGSDGAARPTKGERP